MSKSDRENVKSYNKNAENKILEIMGKYVTQGNSTVKKMQRQKKIEIYLETVKRYYKVGMNIF